MFIDTLAHCSLNVANGSRSAMGQCSVQSMQQIWHCWQLEKYLFRREQRMIFVQGEKVEKDLRSEGERSNEKHRGIETIVGKEKDRETERGDEPR